MTQLVSTAIPERQPQTNWRTRAGRGIQRRWRAVAPGPRAWKGAALGLWIGAYTALMVFTFSYMAAAGVLAFVLGTVGFLAFSALVGLLIRLIVWLLGRIPRLYGWALTVTLPAFVFLGLLAYSVIALLS